MKKTDSKSDRFNMRIKPVIHTMLDEIRVARQGDNVEPPSKTEIIHQLIDEEYQRVTINRGK